MSVTILVKSYDIETTTELNLSDKGLTELPTEICNLTNLRYLDLANNELSELPIELGNLTNLQKLNLASNFLINLPMEIGNLTNLKELRLTSNQLTRIPAEIGNLTKLRYLSLHDNKLINIPTKIGNLTKLIDLCLYNNKLKSLPREILKIKDRCCFQIDETSYDIDNINQEAEILIFTNELYNKITNLPITIKEIWIGKWIDISLIKIPFGCEIKHFLDFD